MIVDVREFREELSVHGRRMERRLDAVLDRLDDLERLLRATSVVVQERAGVLDDVSALRLVLRRMTTRQQGTLQLLLLGAQNDDIARVFGRDLSTAKSYVQSVCHLFGEKRRSMVVGRVSPLWGDVDAEEFLRMRGLPKDWGQEALGAVAAGRVAPLQYFEERRGRMKTAEL